MPIPCNCPQCNATFILQDDLAGKLIRCAKCEATFTAPAAPAEQASAAIQAEPVRPAVSAAPPEWERPRPLRPQPSSGSATAILVIAGVAVVGVLGLFCLVGIGAAIMMMRVEEAAQRRQAAQNLKQIGIAVKEFKPPLDEEPMRPIDIEPFLPPEVPAPPGPPIVKPEPPPIQPGPPAPFQDEINPFPPGTQTRLRELRKFAAPGKAAGLLYSPKHDLLFVRGVAVWVLDGKTGKTLATQAPEHGFSDFALAPDQSALFAADYGGTNIGYGTPRKPSLIHRFDLATRTWERRNAPKIAFRIEAVDGQRFVLQEQDQWVNITLNRWEQNQTVAELDRNGGGYYHGDIDYDPRTGRVYHGNSGSSSREILVCQVADNKLRGVGGTGTYGSANQNGGGSATLSADGGRFYYGRLQVDAVDFKKNLHVFPEPIVAASRDLAFGVKAYYNAADGQQVGELPFAPGVQAVSRDSRFLWASDPASNLLYQYALER